MGPVEIHGRAIGPYRFESPIIGTRLLLLCREYLCRQDEGAAQSSWERVGEEVRVPSFNR